MARTPVNVITGALGAGKTTHILRALASAKPANETWAVVVNDFGALGIDGALLDDAVGTRERDADASGRTIVREVSGGCACCATAAPFVVAVTQVLRRYRPARVLVEPSGMGDAGRVIDALRSEHLEASVDVRATICVVDVRVFGEDEGKAAVLRSELFKAQTECADAMCGSFADAASEAEVEAFLAFGRGFWPKKSAVFLARDRANGMDLALLDGRCGWEPSELSTEATPTTTTTSSRPFTLEPRLTANAPPWMVKQESDRYASCGYAFHVDDVFVRPKLKAFFEEFVLRRVDVARFKGVLRLGADWVRPDIVESIHRSEGTKVRTRTITFASVAYRRDSRFELIRERGVDAAADAEEAAFWDDIRDRLVECRKIPR